MEKHATEGDALRETTASRSSNDDDEDMVEEKNADGRCCATINCCCCCCCCAAEHACILKGFDIIEADGAASDSAEDSDNEQIFSSAHFSPLASHSLLLVAAEVAHPP